MTFANRQKSFLLESGYAFWLVTSVTLGAREGVDVLTVEVAIFARHCQVTPDRFGKIRCFFGELSLIQFLVRILLHDFLLF